jgi:hypothetical protein
LHEISFSSSSSSSLLTKQKLDPSLQILHFPTENSLLYPASATRTLSDDYMTVIDVSPTGNSAPFGDPNQNNLSVDLLNGWYDVLPNTPAPVQSNQNQSSFPFDFSKSETNISNDNLVPISSLSPSQPSYINLIDDPIPPRRLSIDAPISSPSRPSISSESTSKRSSSPTKGEPSTFVHDDTESSKKKKKRKLPKILRLSRKGKNEKKKDSITEEVS